MLKYIVVVCLTFAVTLAQPGVLNQVAYNAPIVADAPGFVNGASSQFLARNFNGLAAPFAAATPIAYSAPALPAPIAYSSSAVVAPAPIAYASPAAYTAPAVYSAPTGYASPYAAPAAYASPAAYAAPVGYSAPAAFSAPAYAAQPVATPFGNPATAPVLL